MSALLPVLAVVVSPDELVVGVVKSEVLTAVLEVVAAVVSVVAAVLLALVLLLLVVPADRLLDVMAALSEVAAAPSVAKRPELAAVADEFEPDVTEKVSVPSLEIS